MVGTFLRCCNLCRIHHRIYLMGEVSSFTSSQASLSNPLNLADTIKQDFRMMEEEFKPKFDIGGFI